MKGRSAVWQHLIMRDIGSILGWGGASEEGEEASRCAWRHAGPKQSKQDAP